MLSAMHFKSMLASMLDAFCEKRKRMLQLYEARVPRLKGGQEFAWRKRSTKQKTFCNCGKQDQ